MAKLPFVERVRELAGFVGGVRSSLRNLETLVRSELASLRRLERLVLRELASAPGPFVCVLAEGVVEDEPVPWSPLPRGLLEASKMGLARRVWLGGSVRVPPGGEAVVELVAQAPMRQVRLVVFADLERVGIREICLGNTLITAYPGPCPMASFESWAVGKKLSVRCTAHRPVQEPGSHPCPMCQADLSSVGP